MCYLTLLIKLEYSGPRCIITLGTFEGLPSTNPSQDITGCDFTFLHKVKTQGLLLMIQLQPTRNHIRRCIWRSHNFKYRYQKERICEPQSYTSSIHTLIARETWHWSIQTGWYIWVFNQKHFMCYSSYSDTEFGHRKDNHIKVALCAH